MAANHQYDGLTGGAMRTMRNVKTEKKGHEVEPLSLLSGGSRPKGMDGH
jgi:hypothetical protein